MRKADNLTTILGHFHEIRNLNFLEPSGHIEPVMGFIYLCVCVRVRACVRVFTYVYVYPHFSKDVCMNTIALFSSFFFFLFCFFRVCPVLWHLLQETKHIFYTKVVNDICKTRIRFKSIFFTGCLLNRGSYGFKCVCYTWCGSRVTNYYCRCFFQSKLIWRIVD